MDHYTLKTQLGKDPIKWNFDDVNKWLELIDMKDFQTAFSKYSSYSNLS